MKALAENGRWRNTCALVAVLLSLVAVAGSLYLSLGMGLRACPLCFYQRAFVMAALAVLVVGFVAERTRVELNCLAALPLAFAGLGVATFHEYLVLAGVLECPQGLLGIGTAPVQSLTTYLLLSAALVGGAWPSRTDKKRRGAILMGSIVLGLLLAWGSIASSPPLPPAPATAYDPVKQPLDMCRPPYRR